MGSALEPSVLGVIGFDELDQNATRDARVNERHFVAARAHAWRFVDETHAERLEERERVLDPFHFDGHVVQAGPALAEKFLQPIVAFGRDQFERRLTAPDGQEHRVGLLRGDDLAHGAFEAERTVPCGFCSVHVGDANRHMINAFDSDHENFVAQRRSLRKGARGAQPFGR